MNDGHLGGSKPDRPSAGTWCPPVWAWLEDRYQIASVLDVGCGVGWALSWWQDYCNARICGVEGAKRYLAAARVEGLVAHDYTTGPLRLDVEFDLVLTTEFVEHVEPRYQDHYLATFDAGRKLLVMTHARPGQGGHHHVNCQPDKYWIRLLETRGWHYLKPTTRAMRTIAPPKRWGRGFYYRRQGLLFAREGIDV